MSCVYTFCINHSTDYWSRTTIALIVRLYYQIRVGIDVDFTYANVPTIIWTTVEFNVGIICASLPGARVALKRCMLLYSMNVQQKKDSTMRYSRYLRRKPSEASSGWEMSNGACNTFSDDGKDTQRGAAIPNVCG